MKQMFTDSHYKPWGVRLVGTDDCGRPIWALVLTGSPRTAITRQPAGIAPDSRGLTCGRW